MLTDEHCGVQNILQKWSFQQVYKYAFIYILQFVEDE